MIEPTLREALATTLDELASMLDDEHAALARRLRHAHDELVRDPSSDLPDSTVRRLRRLVTGTMGGMSDVTFGALVDGRWVVDARERRFRDVSRKFRDQLSKLPPSSPPDLYLVTDRVREVWLVDRGSTNTDSRNVEVQPPIWTGSTTTSEFVVLRGAIDDGDEVEITFEPGSGPSGGATAAPGSPVVDVGRGRVFKSHDGAETPDCQTLPVTTRPQGPRP